MLSVFHSIQPTGGGRDTMQSTTRITLSLFLLTSAAASAYLSSVKLRRDGVLNLYPFPRVGRAAHHTWQIPVNDPTYLNAEMKRQLYAFPRVGRSGVYRPAMHNTVDMADLLLRRDLGISKRESEPSDDGMWFGPRLGRSFRMEDDVAQNDKEQNEDIETGQMETERKKRQVKNT